MRVNVKILQGAECNVEILPADSVEHLKELVQVLLLLLLLSRLTFDLLQVQLNISPSNQRLVLKGKTLQDGTLLEEYHLKEGDRLHLVVKKDSSSVQTTNKTTTGCIETQTETPARVILEREMSRILKPYYTSDTEVRKVVSAFVKNIERKLNSLSLDDIEKICEMWNTEKVVQF